MAKIIDYTTGEYSVGTEMFSTVDLSREEKFGQDDSSEKANRRITVRMYYPVSKDAVAGMERAYIFSEPKKKAVAKAFFFNMNKISDEDLRADYYEKAPFIEGETYPLIVFNHGYNSYVEANTYLCIDLASHGYIVASVGHAYEAVETDYEDGTYVLFDKNINKMMYTNMWKAVRTQSKLLKKQLSPKEAYEGFVSFQDAYVPYIRDRLPDWHADNMCALKEIKARYEKHLDLSKGIGASGHSFGGATAYYLCMNEPEFACGINIDGALFGKYENQTMEKPFFQICCKENYNVETKPLLNTNAPVHYALFENMKHIGFTDIKFHVTLKAIAGSMDAKIMYKHLSDIHIKFFDKYLKQLDVTLPSESADGVIYQGQE